MQELKKTDHNRDNKAKYIKLVWACTENGTKQNSQKSRPRNRWQDEVRDDGRIVGGEGWQEKVRVHNREEWKKLLRMARNHHILHMPME